MDHTGRRLKVAVVGGGPGGLATLKFLLTAHKYFPIPPIEARLFEAEAEVGGTFVYRVYEDSELVSSKYLTAFSDFRLPPDAPDFVTPQRYVQYLRDYAAHFGLLDSIECLSRVNSIRRNPNGGGHVVNVKRSTGEAVEWVCDAVAVCSGLNVTPLIPNVEGIQKVPVVLHSSQVKARTDFGNGTDVLVLGAGETAMDMAHLAVTASTRSVTLAHRDGFFCAPKIIPSPMFWGQAGADKPNKPVDTSVASLFDTAYVPPMLQRSQLLWYAYDRWVKSMHRLISGTEEGPDQWVGHMSKDRKYLDSLLMVKSARALPYISEGHRSTSWLNRLRQSLINVPIRETGGRRIDVVNWPECIDDDGFMVSPSSRKKNSPSQKSFLKPDVVVFATGYKTEFPFLDGEYPHLDHLDVRGVYKDDDVSVGFIGFVRPSIGAIPPLAELQAQLWVLKLVQGSYPALMSSPKDVNAIEHYELDYKLHPRGSYDFSISKRGVDHESYAYQLAVDMGAAPTASFVFSQGWKVFFTWAMGSNFNTKFRLVGPWKNERVAVDVMSNELFNIVKKSGGVFFFLTYTLMPLIVFGSMSMVIHAGSACLNVLLKLGEIIERVFR